MNPNRPQKSSSKSSLKIDAIAAAGAGLFSAKGYTETSMEDVAAAAKISKGGMYHYFACKEDILYFILSRFLDLLMEGLDEEIGRIKDPTDKIRHVIRHHVEAYAAHMYSAKALLNEAHNLSASNLAKIKSREKHYFSTITGVLSLYAGERLSKEMLTVVTFNLLGMSNWIYSWYDPRGAINPGRLAEIIFGNFVKGLSGLEGESRPG